MAPNNFCLRRDILIYALAAGLILVPALLFFAGNVHSQEPTPAPGPSSEDAQIQAALGDLSQIYGQPVTRVEQAHAICNLEQYMADCADIGKEHGLYTPEEVKQVNTVLTELKGKVIDDLKSCTDDACLITVANQLAKNLASKNPTLARDLDLTPAKVQEKKVIVDTAKEIGVNFQDCRTMDPDTASVDLLRSCAKLAKHENVIKILPDEVKQAVRQTDTALNLKEALGKGDLQCGDNTLKGCGNFCLNPAEASRATGVSAIPAVCRQIAESFFGDKGVKQLEDAYGHVKDAAQYYQKRSETVTFTTQDARTLTNPADIGRYMEAEMKRGNVEAIEKGMDFMVAKGFVSSQDKDFAVRMAKKIREGGGQIDFDRCSSNPKECEAFVPDEHRAEFQVMEEVHRIMSDEMRARGVPDPSLCESSPQYGDTCVKAARAALPKLEAIEDKFPKAFEVSRFIDEIDRRIGFIEGGLDARKRAEEKFSGGGQVNIGGRTFSNFGEVDSFCRQNGSLCLADAAKEGLINKDYAASKYEHTYEVQYGFAEPAPGFGFPGTGPFPGFVQPGFGGIPPGQISGSISPGPGFGPPPGFNKEEALKQFQQWLDNPIGAPPIPSVGYPGGPGGPYPGYPGGPGPYPGVPYPGGPPYPPGVPPYPGGPGPYPGGPSYCPTVFSRPCPVGQYRQQSYNERGCQVLSECVSVSRGDQVPVGPNVTCRTSYNNRASCESSPSCYWMEGAGVCRNRYCPVYGAAVPVCKPGQNSLSDTGCEVCRADQAVQPPICPALASVDSCPAGQRKVITYSSKECGNYYGCEPDISQQCPGSQYWDGTRCVPTITEKDCFANQYWDPVTQYCVSKDLSQNCPSDQFWTDGKGCQFKSPKCPYGRYWDGKVCVAGPTDVKFPYNFSSGYVAHGPEEARRHCEIINFFDNYICPRLGVKEEFPSPISVPPFPQPPPGGINFPYKFSSTGYVANSDADMRRYCSEEAPGTGGPGNPPYEAARAECQKWSMPWGGSYTPPGPSGCGGYNTRASCNSSGCYWSRTDLESGPYCSTSGGGGSTQQRCFYPNASINGASPGYTVWCEKDYFNCRKGSPSGESISLTGLSLGAPSSCEYGWTGGGGPATGTCTQELMSLLGSGCHSMGNAFFDGSMAKYVWPGTNVVKDCSTSYISNCTVGGGTSPSGQRNQTWNSFGLQSQIRTDADPARIEQLKQACANVKSGANIWMPGAGDYASANFGMPDPAKCNIAASCTSSQYFDGNACVTGTTTTTTTTCPSGQYWYVPTGGGPGYCKSTSTTDCPSGQYWYVPPGGGSGYCTSSTTPPPAGTTSSCDSQLISLLGTGCHWMYYDSSGKEIFCDGSMTKSAKRGDTVTTSGCTSPGTTTPPPTSSTCPSSFAHDMGGYCMLNADTLRCAEYYNSSVEANYTTAVCTQRSGTTTTTTCPSGQYWYVPTGGGPGYCKSTSTTDCPSGQYWNGTACVTSTTSTCPSGQYWYVPPGGGSGYCQSSSTPPPSTTSCNNNYVCDSWESYSSCPSDCSGSSTSCNTPSNCFDSAKCSSSGWYWYNGGCWSSPQTTTTPPPSTTTTCPSGQYWNGTACVTSTTTPPPTPPPPPSGPVCGNATCESGLGETSSSCPGDCPPPPPPPPPPTSPPPEPPPPPPPSPPPSAFFSPKLCPANHDWNGYYCVVRPQYTAHFFAQVRTSMSQIGGIIGSLFGW